MKHRHHAARRLSMQLGHEFAMMLIDASIMASPDDEADAMLSTAVHQIQIIPSTIRDVDESVPIWC